MEVTKIAAAAGAGEPATARNTQRTGATSLDYDAFLRLLMAQMQNQDPLEPMKSSDYVAQLATFSQVEQSVQTNKGVAALLSAARLQQAESLIGRTVSSADGSVSGMVAAARIAGDNVVAILADGREFKVDNGVTVSGSAA